MKADANARAFGDLLRSLSQTYTPEGVGVWLTGRHRLLDNRTPIEVLIEDGDLRRIQALVDQLESGAFV